MKHKHAELIKQWADDKSIKLQLYGETEGQWFDDYCPSWSEDTKYRIKPEEKKPVVRWLWTYRDISGLWRMTNAFLTEDEMDKKSNGNLFYKLEWSRTEFPK